MENITSITSLTIEEHVAVMNALKEELQRICAASAGAYTNPDANPSYNDLLKTAAAKVELFNLHSMTAEFMHCEQADDPMLEFVRRFTYLRASAKERVKKSGTTELRNIDLSIEPAQMDLLKFAKYVESPIGHGDWYSAIQQLCLRLTMKAAASIGISPEEIGRIDDSFNMTKLARAFALARADESGSTPDPVSKTQMVKTLDLILELMLGEGYHCDTRDVAFLQGCFTRKGRKALTLKAANTKELAGLIHQIAHRVLEGKAYSIECYVKKPRD